MSIISGGGGGSSAALLATKRLTSADILALNTTPITLVSGASGFAIVPVFLAVVVLRGGTTYTGAYNLRLFVGPTFAGSGWGASAAPQNLFNVNPSAASYDIVSAMQGDSQALTLLDGQPLRIDTSGAVLTGDGTAVVSVLYVMAPLA